MNSMNTSLSLRTAGRLEKKETKLKSLVGRRTVQLQKYQTARLVSGLLFFLSLVPFSMKVDAQLELILAALVLTIFIFLVIRTKQIHRHVQKLERLLQFVTRQKWRCLGQPSGRAWKEAEEKSKAFAMIRDLGLTGSHSLWTLLDETFSEGGQYKLLQWLSTKPLDKSILQSRQQAIQGLRSQAWFYTRLGIDANTDELNLSTLQIQDFLKEPFVAANFSKVLLVNLLAWLVTATLVLGAALMQVSLPSYLLLVFPLVSLSSLGTVGSAFLKGVGLSHHLSALVPIFTAIEKRARYHEELRRLCSRIVEESPSRATRKLDFILGFLGTQTNPILHLVINTFVPWTVVAAYFLERHRKKIVHGFGHCLEELAELEVIGSLVIFDKYQTQTYPQYSEQLQLECRQIFHPLLDRTRAVANDFSFAAQKSLGLLTGSNMSGKSTFLRTIGINQILANMGAPVFAENFVTRPVQVETCIEVSDSLRDGYSYFYAEVRRLRDILQSAARQEKVLYLIDEIFRGTNNRERQIGSRAVIQTLAQEKQALGFISTHDLELTSLESTNPSLVNLHFKEDIDADGKMIFSYQLKHGPCPTTNALRIMAAEGIKVEP